MYISMYRVLNMIHMCVYVCVESREAKMTVTTHGTCIDVYYLIFILVIKS